MNVRDVMSSTVVSCEITDSIEQVALMMKDQNIGVLPVLDQGKIVGMVTDRDVVIRGVAEHKGKQIDQVMTHEVISVTQDTTAEEAANLMAEKQVRRLPVVENEKVVGMVSLGDLAVSPQANDEAGDALTDISQP
ncbi:CBS domain-containing protein [Jeotgalibacillus proteolyticus]|uniref:CBS domain-containing protein n=1 Tax=Jeotgalibacillus proteolyticus TaxID=2082395 RepID=A0A2S5GC16_9BACL|nr:CBS domain-containing protein [Jeotgalibacillus proteolyticus]PPA70572.1 CBS domain-containing protein [Jeotgalibacillus proteolyticus]